MIYLLLAIISSSLVSIFMRLNEKHISNQMGMFMSNYIICMLLSYIFMNKQLHYSINQSTITMIVLGIMSGILYLTSFVLLKINMKYNGMVLSSTFMKLGVLIPTLMAIAFFHEIPTFFQIFGILLAVLAIIIIHFDKDALSQGSRKILLLILLVMNGLTDAMANIFEQLGNMNDKDGYLLITFFIAFLLATLLACKNQTKITKKDVLSGIMIGLPNYFSSRFLLLSLSSLNAVIVYPVFSIATVIVITMTGVFFFHETLNKKKIYALLLIIISLCLLNI